MRFGRTCRLPEITPDDIAVFAKDVGIAPRAVHRRLERMSERAPAAWDPVHNLPELAGHAGMIESVRAGWDQRLKQIRGGR